MEALNESYLDWGVAARPLPGESSSGDASVVAPFLGGLVLAVADGLGHGEAAAATAKICMASLTAHAGEPIERMLLWCHQDLMGTRGVALSLASYDTVRCELTWLGVGNIESVFCAVGQEVPVRPRWLVVRNGVVGMRLPPIKVTRIPVTPGDVLVLATDGIAEGFTTAIRATEPPQRIADEVLAKYAKESDDALVLVVRFQGRPS